MIAIIGILVALLLPAVQSAREAARRAQCTNNMVQLIIAVHNYESSNRVYPPGTIEDSGPIQNVPQGYHHNWISQLLPYLEQRAVFNHTDRTVGVYHPNNAEVRDMRMSVLLCPSSPASNAAGYSSYAGIHHDVEAPIDTDNHGLFFLNSSVRYIDVSDGASQTLFMGEKLILSGDLGWMSGTRATLRNTGTPINAVLAARNRPQRAGGPPSKTGGMGDSEGGMMSMESVSEDAALPPDEPTTEGTTDAETEAADNDDPDSKTDDDANSETDAATEDATDDVTDDEPSADAETEGMAATAEPEDEDGDPATIVDGQPVNVTAVGGLSSDHPAGINVTFGDGSVRFLTETIDMQVLRQLGHRADGMLLNYDF